MKSIFSSFTLIVLSICLSYSQTAINSNYPFSPIPFTETSISDSFWGQRLLSSRNITIPLAFSKCQETGRYENFVKAYKQMTSETNLGYEVKGWPFDDTDIYKTIEGASYILSSFPDKKLEEYIDSILTFVAKAQEPDGYLYTPRTMNPAKPHNASGNTRWSNEEYGSHELYNLGHMVEGAIAHYQATGKRNFLDIAIKYADCVCREVGPMDNQAHVVPGHQITEMALAKLYVITQDKKYLDEALYFIEQRGKTAVKRAYSQSHLPILEQKEAVGHAVRAMYMYSGTADVAALTGKSEYINAMEQIWKDIATSKLYITGGVGSTSRGEAFESGYILPNLTSYCETCAAIGNVYFNYRMFLMNGKSKYYDVLERSLYNGLISGVSIDGGKFFYPNPLESDGSHERQPWFGCACCPSNICRFIPSLPGYIYAEKDNNLYVNLFISNTLRHNIAGKKVVLSQKTNYPWNGDVEIIIDSIDQKKPFNIKIRIPGWVKNEVIPESDLYSYIDGKDLHYDIKVNGKSIGTYDTNDGYFTILKKWKKGDKISIHFDMEARIVKANDLVKADVGLVAIERGPIVYCAEWPDNKTDLSKISISGNPDITTSFKENMLNGINTLNITNGTNDVLTLIPYYSWCHRGKGKMKVWINYVK